MKNNNKNNFLKILDKDDKDFEKQFNDLKKNPNSSAIQISENSIEDYEKALEFITSDEFGDKYIPRKRQTGEYSTIVDEIAKYESYVIVKATVEELISEELTVEEFNDFIDKNMNSERYRKMIASYNMLRSITNDEE